MSLNPRPMSRWKAAGIHLLLSVAIAATVVAFMLVVWYPWPLFEAAGGSHLILILVGVDVTLGPLITLIIFKSGKKGLKFDLTVIALCQLAALAYGIHTLYLARPIYIVFTVDRFELVTAKDIDLPDLAKVTLPEFKSLPLGRPRYIAAVAPENQDEKLKLIESAMRGKDLQMYPQYYVPYEQQAADALKRAKDMSVLIKRNPEAVRSALKSLGRPEASVKFLPMRAPQKDGAILLDAASGAPLDIVLVEAF
jgi:hypothetical protein